MTHTHIKVYMHSHNTSFVTTNSGTVNTNFLHLPCYFILCPKMVFTTFPYFLKTYHYLKFKDQEQSIISFGFHITLI